LEPEEVAAMIINALGGLRTLELVQGRGDLRASKDLFDDAM